MENQEHQYNQILDVTKKDTDDSTFLSHLLGGTEKNN
jgi:hypothetical protein